MAEIQAGYFVINGISAEKICKALPFDDINLECWVRFDKDEIGNEYKAELKVLLPSGKEFSYYTPLEKVNENHVFKSAKFDVPIPIGQYSTAWFVIYDTNGKTISDGHGRGLNCENLIIEESYKSKKIGAR